MHGSSVISMEGNLVPSSNVVKLLQVCHRSWYECSHVAMRKGREVSGPSYYVVTTLYIVFSVSYGVLCHYGDFL